MYRGNGESFEVGGSNDVIMEKLEATMVYTHSSIVCENVPSTGHLVSPRTATPTPTMRGLPLVETSKSGKVPEPTPWIYALNDVRNPQHRLIKWQRNSRPRNTKTKEKNDAPRASRRRQPVWQHRIPVPASIPSATHTATCAQIQAMSLHNAESIVSYNVHSEQATNSSIY